MQDEHASPIPAAAAAILDPAQPLPVQRPLAESFPSSSR